MKIQTITGRFEDGGKVYTFIAPDSLTWLLDPGCHVAVETTAGLRIVEVVDVHGEDRREQIKGWYNIDFKWAFQLVDLTRLDALQGCE